MPGYMSVAVATAESDSRLLERIAGGDRDAFTELYRRFARPVFAMAVRQLGDNGRAEEAAQETFAAVWRSARSYRPERGSASAWLYAVARHAIIDRARQRREPVVEVPEEASTEAGPAEQAEGVLARLAGAQRARAGPRARARGARARLLERPLAGRDRQLSRRAARNGQDEDAHRAGPSGRAARRGTSMREPRTSTSSSAATSRPSSSSGCGTWTRCCAASRRRRTTCRQA